MADKGSQPQVTTKVPQPTKTVVSTPDMQRGYTAPKPAPKTNTSTKK
jgi:hypothetical protein